MIREMGNAELFELCENKSKSAMLRMPFILESRSDLLHLWTSWLKANPVKILVNGDWMLSPSRTTSSRRGDPTVLGTAKPTHRKSISWAITRGRDVSKRILKEFTIVSNEIQYIVIRNSKLAGPRRSASRWTSWHRKTTPTAHPLRNMRDIGKSGMSHWKNQAEMHRWDSDQTSEQQSQLWNVPTKSLEKNDLNQSLFINTKGDIRLLLPVLHGGSGMKTGGALFFLKKNCCSKIAYSWWQSAATDGRWKQFSSHVTFFSCLRSCVIICHTTLAQVFVRVISSMSHAPVCLISLGPSLRTLHLSLPSSTSSSWSFTSSSMWMLPEQDPLCTSPTEGFGPLVNNAPLTGYEPKFFDDYHFSETTEIFIQESSSDTRPSYMHDTQISDDTIGRALSSPQFTQEREEPAGLRQACQSPEENVLSSQSLSVGHVRTGRPINELGSLSSSVRENPSRDSDNESSTTLTDFPSVSGHLTHSRDFHSISDLYANSLWRFTLRKWSCEVLSLHTPVGYSRPPSAVNDPTVTK